VRYVPTKGPARTCRRAGLRGAPFGVRRTHAKADGDGSKARQIISLQVGAVLLDEGHGMDPGQLDAGDTAGFAFG
jgi:hypothetical protein